MARSRIFDSPIASAVNAFFAGLLKVPVVGRLAGRNLVVIRYVGRRSGRTFETPVNYRRSRSSDEIVIGIMSPDAKNWWRNFLDEGAPITLVGLDGRDRTGHAQARRHDGGGVSVAVRLDP